MDLEGECTTRATSVFQLKRKRGKDFFNAESNSRFSWRFSMEAQTEKRIDNPRFIYLYHGLAIRLLLSGGKKRLINIALLRVYNGKSLLAHRQSHRGRRTKWQRTGRIRERTY